MGTLWNVAAHPTKPGSHVFICPRCDKPCEIPSFVMADIEELINGHRVKKTKLRAECPNGECMFLDRSLGPEHFNQGITSSLSELQQGKVKVADEPAPAPTAARPAPAPQPTSQPQPTSPLVQPPAAVSAALPIEDQLQQRALYLGSEEARLEGIIAATRSQLAGVKVERKKLARMLAAAEAVTKATKSTTAASVDPEGTRPATTPITEH